MTGFCVRDAVGFSYWEHTGNYYGNTFLIGRTPWKQMFKTHITQWCVLSPTEWNEKDEQLFLVWRTCGSGHSRKFQNKLPVLLGAQGQ